VYECVHVSNIYPSGESELIECVSVCTCIKYIPFRRIGTHRMCIIVYMYKIYTLPENRNSKNVYQCVHYTCTDSYTFYEFRFSRMVYILYPYTLIHILWVPILRKGIYFIHVHTDTHSMSSDSPEGYIFIHVHTHTHSN
jgi:hypothetical protein